MGIVFSFMQVCGLVCLVLLYVGTIADFFLKQAASKRKL